MLRAFLSLSVRAAVLWLLGITDLHGTYSQSSLNLAQHARNYRTRFTA
jgi:hypothetical protein